MKNIKKKVQTLQALVNGSSKISNAGKRAAIIDEFDEIARCCTLQPQRRRRLLNALHAARGLEGTVLQVLGHHMIPVPTNRRSLGGYLYLLANAAPPLLPSFLKSKCQTELVDLRNRLTHETGYYPPGDLDIDRALRRVEDCLTTILR